jgi:hypothetical protein
MKSPILFVGGFVERDNERSLFPPIEDAAF